MLRAPELRVTLKFKKKNKYTAQIYERHFIILYIRARKRRTFCERLYMKFCSSGVLVVEYGKLICAHLKTALMLAARGRFRWMVDLI